MLSDKEGSFKLNDYNSALNTDDVCVIEIAKTDNVCNREIC